MIHGRKFSHQFGAIGVEEAVRFGCSVDNKPCKDTICLMYYNQCCLVRRAIFRITDLVGSAGLADEIYSVYTFHGRFSAVFHFRTSLKTSKPSLHREA